MIMPLNDEEEETLISFIKNYPDEVAKQLYMPFFPDKSTIIGIRFVPEADRVNRQTKGPIECVSLLVDYMHGGHEQTIGGPRSVPSLKQLSIRYPYYVAMKQYHLASDAMQISIASPVHYIGKGDQVYLRFPDEDTCNKAMTALKHLLPPPQNAYRKASQSLSIAVNPEFIDRLKEKNEEYQKYLKDEKIRKAAYQPDAESSDESDEESDAEHPDTRTEERDRKETKTNLVSAYQNLGLYGYHAQDEQDATSSPHPGA
jgi:hypothetical protein